MLRAIFELKRPVRSEFLEAVFELTEGNPFFIEEVLGSLIAAGDIFLTERGWDRKPLDELHIPRSVQDAVGRRLERLSSGAGEIVVIAAVAGRRFDFALLRELTGHDERALLQRIKELISAQLGAALKHAERALELAGDIAHKQWLTGAQCTLGQCYLLALKPYLARQALEAGLALAKQVGSALWTGVAKAFLARSYLLERDLTRAEAILTAALPESEPRNVQERQLLWT